MENVEFRNFLNDYESLIYVENDNVIASSQKVEMKNMQIYHYGNYEISANIQIDGCKFTDSSFDYGMIYVPTNIESFFGQPYRYGSNVLNPMVIYHY